MINYLISTFAGQVLLDESLRTSGHGGGNELSWTPSAFQFNSFLWQEEVLLNIPNDMFSAEHASVVDREAWDLWLYLLLLLIFGPLRRQNGPPEDFGRIAGPVVHYTPEVSGSNWAILLARRFDMLLDSVLTTLWWRDHFHMTDPPMATSSVRYNVESLCISFYAEWVFRATLCRNSG